MARSARKQGNRKHRLKLKTKDGKLLKDANGRPITVGVLAKPMGSLRGDRRRAAEAAMWEDVRREREARETAEMAIRARINARLD